VVGRSDAPKGAGVRGFVTDATPGVGVLGQAGISGGTGVGVRGENVNVANSGNAVEGLTNGSGAAIFGQGATAGEFDGDVTVTGDFEVSGAKNFRIDHPLDPANKTLTHAAVESDEHAVTYSGNVTTTAAGRATVSLPPYAGALAHRWRYQLTPIGSFTQAIVAREVAADGTFVVRTRRPRTKLSWSVVGTRRDPFARMSPVVTVQPKRGDERGRYLNPEAYGRR
jgi:hypothetical protein